VAAVFVGGGGLDCAAACWPPGFSKSGRSQPRARSFLLGALGVERHGNVGARIAR
jgi:hypothetical protein